MSENRGARRLAIIAALVGAVVGGLAAGAAAAEPMVATTQLGWVRNGEFAPILVAEAKGFFKDAGIEHHIIDDGPGKNPIPIVAVGQAEFGISTSALYLIAARAARDPVDVVAIGTNFQITPSSYIRLATPGTPEPTPKDLLGKAIGVQANTEFLLRALAVKNGLDPAALKFVTVQANAEPLMVGQVDFFLGWITNQTYQIEQEAAKPDAPPSLKGKTWQALRFSQWSMPSYADVIFTTGATLKAKPELVKAYLRAVARGMQAILDDPAGTIELTAHFPGQIEDTAKLAWRWPKQGPLFTGTETAQHGLLWMSPEIWEQMVDLMKNGDQIPSRLPVGELMTDAFLPGPLAK